MNVRSHHVVKRRTNFVAHSFRSLNSFLFTDHVLQDLFHVSYMCGPVCVRGLECYSQLRMHLLLQFRLSPRFWATSESKGQDPSAHLSRGGTFRLINARSVQQCIAFTPISYIFWTLLMKMLFPRRFQFSFFVFCTVMVSYLLLYFLNEDGIERGSMSI